MKNKIKTLIVAITCIPFMTGCIKVIDPQSGTATTEQAGNAPGSFSNFVSAITNTLSGSFTYSGADQYPYDFGYPSFFIMRDVMGQDIVLEDGGSEHYTPWYTCGVGLGSKYAISQVPWTYYYGWIKNCNTVITLSKVGDFTPEKQHGAGIAYAMRAMFYMDMARMYAQKTYAKDKNAETVPLIFETTTSIEAANNPRATNEAMWAHIIADLDQAEIDLADYTRSNVYTPNISVVYGLKARAYLTMEDWAKAEEYAKKAQNGFTPMAESDYTSKTNGFNSPNASWLFGLTFKSTDDNILQNDGDCSWGSQMIVEVSASGCGYAANYGFPKRIDYHLYSGIPTTDFRRKCFIDFAIDKMSEDDALTALSAYSDEPAGLLTTANATPSKVVGGLELKFRPANGEHANQYEAFTVAVPMMRVEEMMLIEAEAAGMQNEAKGISLLTTFAQTRDPQYVYGTHRDNFFNSTATAFQNEVLWQRRVELWGEGFATFDIKRMDKGIIRSYADTNHPAGYRWNYGIYTTNEANYHPDWMDLCIVDTESNYNNACTNNPTPIMPSTDSAPHTWQ